MPTRLVVCVDGTWFGPDGRDGTPQGNISNVFRIWAVVKEGLVIDNDGRRFEQKKRYFEGIGVGEKGPRRWGDGIWGTGCTAQIKRVYQCCCETLTEPEDELWLYGYSRGAFVVRAVAGLVHHIKLLKFPNQQQFDSNYENAVNVLMEHIKTGGRNYQGQIYKYFHEAVRDPPKVRFVGVFDSVKAFKDHQLFEFSYTKSIDHLRHAVSLNENRPLYDAELIHLSEDPNTCDRPRSMIQAWFLGTHSDLGGGSREDGLSLYPLQWILTESRRCGLELEFRQNKHGCDLLDNPLDIVFPTNSTPSSNEEGRSELAPYSESAGVPWLFAYVGGIQVHLYDLRPTHARNIARNETRADAKGTPPNLKDKKFGTKISIFHKKTVSKDSTSKDSSSEPSTLTTVSSPYRIGFNSTKLLVKNSRKPFQKHKLEGYDDKAAYGTIIHPSVYFLFDVYQQIYCTTAIGFRQDIEQFRLEAFSNGTVFPWAKGAIALENNMSVFRILVCGRAGVGKSTLINRVFGVEVTAESDLKHGIHNIEEAIESEYNPGLRIHDSLGFRTGDVEGIKKVERFVQARSGADITKRLHAIWFCVPLTATRLLDEADIRLFKAVHKAGSKVPIVFVGTMTDKFLDEWETKVKRRLGMTETDAVIRAELQDVFLTRQNEVIGEIESALLENGLPALDASAYVAKDDADSVKDLLRKTLGCLKDDRVIVKLIGAQVCDVDQKVIIAITETLRLCQHAIINAVISIPGADIVGTPTIARLICDAALRSFGFSKIHSTEMEEIMRQIVWQSMYKFLYRTVPILAMTITAMVFAAPLSLIPIAMNSLISTPATARVVVSCSCDIILCLERSSSVDSDWVGSKGVKAAAEWYKVNLFDTVHQEVATLIPEYNLKSSPMGGLGQSFQFSKLRIGMEAIIDRHRTSKPTKDLQAEIESLANSGSEDDSDDDVLRRLNKHDHVDDVLKQLEDSV